MNLNHVLGESLDRGYRINRKIDGVLHHYTSLHALHAIINTGTFWGTRSEFLNDTSELKHIKTVIEAVTAKITENNPEYPFKEAIIKSLNGFYFNTHHPSKCYLLSLTDVADLITNWSSYSNFDGYNIGLDAFELHEILDYRYAKAYLSGYVIYNEDTQENIIKEEFENYLQIWRLIPDCSEEDLNKIVEQFMYRILIYGCFFKHPSFKQEEEYRIAFFPEDFPDSQKVSVRFRTSKGVLIPFIELDFKEIAGDRPKLPLKEVWIGPTNKMDNAILGLDAFLSSLGYNTEATEATRIMTSVIPLRF